VGGEGEAVATRGVPRVALNLPEVAATVGVSLRFVRDESRPQARAVGRRMRMGVHELEWWVDDSVLHPDLARGGGDAR
jgi:hypothetical protein